MYRNITSNPLCIINIHQKLGRRGGGTGGVAQVIEQLPSKHKAQISNLSTIGEKRNSASSQGSLASLNMFSQAHLSHPVLATVPPGPQRSCRPTLVLFYQLCKAFWTVWPIGFLLSFPGASLSLSLLLFFFSELGIEPEPRAC